MNPYGEDRCAVNAPLVISSVFWPAAFLACLTAIVLTGNPLLFFPGLASVLGVAFSMAPFMLIASRRISIRVDEDGIRIGAVRQARHQPGARRRVPPQSQRSQVFAAPWSAISQIEVVTGRRELKQLRRVGQDLGSRRAEKVAVGRLWTPQMRAALVINVNVERASWPEFLDYGEVRHGRLGKATNKTRWQRSAVWLAPTRHPRELREVLAQAAAAGLLGGHGGNFPGASTPDGRGIRATGRAE